MELKRAVITGLGALTPIGNNVKSYWEALASGQNGVGPITHFDASKFKTRFACEIKGFDPLDFIHRKEAKKMDRFTQYAVVVADEALTDSGLDLEKEDRTRIGVIWGSGIGGIITFQEEVEGFLNNDKTPRFNPFFIPKMIIDLSSGQISIRHGLMGVNFSTVSACATSTHAIIDAYNYIRLGKANAIVTGGSEAAVTEAGVGGFNASKALSEDNDAPERASRPFDKTRNGFVLGEGAAGMVVEELEHAKARGAKIYGEIVGAGMTADAYHITAPHPEGLGARNVMIEALSDAGMQKEEIDYINVHGTSTPLGDLAEATAIQHVFQDHAKKLNISSTKSMTGHLLGAAGAIEALASVMAIEKQMIPPTINHQEKDDELPDLNYTLNTPQHRQVNAVMSNTFGFGGHNASIIIKKYTGS